MSIHVLIYASYGRLPHDFADTFELGQSKKSVILPHRIHCHSSQSLLLSWVAHEHGHAVNKQTRKQWFRRDALSRELFHLGVIWQTNVTEAVSIESLHYFTVCWRSQSRVLLLCNKSEEGDCAFQQVCYLHTTETTYFYALDVTDFSLLPYRCQTPCACKTGHLYN